MEINPNVENLEANSTSEDEVWGMPKYQQNYLSNLTNLTDEQYLAVVIISTLEFGINILLLRGYGLITNLKD